MADWNLPPLSALGFTHFRRQPMPEVPPEMMLPTLTGQENAPPPQPPGPSTGLQLSAMLMGFLNPFGLTPPDTTVMQSPGQTLTGRVLPPTPRNLSFRSDAPDAEEAGSLLAILGPAGRAGGRALTAGARRFTPQQLGLIGGGAAGTGGVLALGEPAPTEAQGRPPPSDEVKALQRRLQEAGFYRGEIDGRLGPETERANAAFQAREAERAAERARQTELDLQKAQNEAERERIRLESQREERTRVEGERAERVAQEGMERFRNMRPSWMQEYGGYLGYPLGFGMGLGGRYGMSRILNREAREGSRRAAEMSRNMGTGDVPERVGRVTDFWATGAPGSPPPFSFQSGRQPFPWTTNPAAVPSGDLYRGSALSRFGPGGLTFGVGTGETGLGAVWLSNARRELEEAQRALDARMSPANVQRLEDARNAVSQAEFLMRTGMGTLAGGTVGELESMITRGRLRPSIQAAEAERGRVDQLLNPAGPPPPQPTWDAAIGRWRLNGGFVRGPRQGP